MAGVGGDGRRKLSCARGQPMGYRTPLALVGKGRPRAAGPCSLDGQGNRAVDHAAGAAPADSQTKREKQWPHFGKSTTRSANGNRSVHHQTTNRSSMACALPAPPMGTALSTAGQRTAHPWHVLSLRPSRMAAGRIHNIWKGNSAALACGHAALDMLGGVCNDSA